MHLTVADASALLRTPEKQIYRWIDEGELACNWFHDQPRFNRTELLEWATARRMPVAIEQFIDDEDESPPSFVESLSAGGIHRQIGGADREAVLRAVVGVVQIPTDDRETLLQVLLAREAAGTTGIGEGIAIPHARHPIVMGGTRSCISLCFLEKPVDFHAIDGGLVHTLFLMISATVRGHLQSLAQLSSTLRDPGFKDAVLRRASTDDILREAARVETAFPRPARG
jgi:PTS system nitrogen regulatory IIA component